MPNDECPFKVGDRVFYRPSKEGTRSSIMNSPVEPPKIGQAVKIAKIIDGHYIQWEGYNHHSGGIHWAEFSAT
jgi:hypothetical protein